MAFYKLEKVLASSGKFFPFEGNHQTLSLEVFHVLTGKKRGLSISWNVVQVK